MTDKDSAPVLDEEVVAVLMDWWFNLPVGDGETDLDCALDDVRAMLLHLHEHGFKVVSHAR